MQYKCNNWKKVDYNFFAVWAQVWQEIPKSRGQKKCRAGSSYRYGTFVTFPLNSNEGTYTLAREAGSFPFPTFHNFPTFPYKSKHYDRFKSFLRPLKNKSGTLHLEKTPPNSPRTPPETFRKFKHFRNSQTQTFPRNFKTNSCLLVVFVLFFCVWLWGVSRCFK